MSAGAQLHARTIVVVGGAGFVGGHIAARLLAHGATVVVPTRSAARAEALRVRVAEPARIGRLITEVADLSAEDGGAQFVAALASRHLRPTDAVAALGAWWTGPALTQVPPATWRELVEDGLTSHFLAARTLIPTLPPDGQYVMMAGIAAELAVAGSGPISVTGAAQRMLARVLAVESRQLGNGAAVRELALLAPVVGTLADGRAEYPGEPIMLGDAVGERVVRILRTPPRAGQVVLRMRGAIPPGCLATAQ